MTGDPEPRNGAIFYETIEHLHRIGTPAEQLAWQDRAWEMLEVWPDPPEYPGTRLAGAWLRVRQWRVQFACQLDMAKADWVAPLAEAVIRRGHTDLIGMQVGFGEWRRTAVWRVPANTYDITGFYSAQYCNSTLLFPADCSFAIHNNGNEELTAYAGPEAFLRDALPPENADAQPPRIPCFCVADKLADPLYDDFFAPYRPFMLA